MRTPFASFLPLLSLGVSASRPHARELLIGSLQTGPEENGSFASAVLFNPADNTVLVTGSAYGTAFDSENQDKGEGKENAYRCFLGVLGLSDMQWKHRQTLGHTITTESANSTDGPESVSQACSHILLHDGRLFLSGHAGREPGGVLDDIYNPGDLQENIRYGTLMDLRPGDPAGDAGQSYELAGGLALQESAAVYPVSLTSSPSDSFIYVASMTTDQSNENNEGIALAADPNLSLPIGERDMLTIEEFGLLSTTPGTLPIKTLKRNTRTFYNPRSGDSVYVAGMVKLSDSVLVVAGHTRGQGEGFGKSYRSSNLDEPSSTHDGFVTKFKPENLEPVITENDAMASTHRVESLDGGDEEVMGICHHGHGQAPDTDHVYVVGKTTGNILRSVPADAGQLNRTEAFIMKIKISTMEMVWEKQLGLDSEDTTSPLARVEGISCAVTRDGQYVWWAGHVTDGGSVQGSNIDKGYGNSDIFVSMLLAENGEDELIHQIGSEAEDTLALRGGLTVNTDGNAIVVGNTYGSMYRTKSNVNQETVSDVFLATFTPSGDISVPVGHPDYVPPSDSVVPLAPLPTTPEQPVSPPSPATPVETATPPSSSDTEPSPFTTSSSNIGKIALVLVLIALLSGVTMSIMFVDNTLKHREALTDRSEVLKYLNTFDVEDVDLKHSATGGWHCSYANDLAQGKFEHKTLPPRSRDYESDSPSEFHGGDPLKTPLTSGSTTSIAAGKDSLFMHEDDTPGYGDSPGLSARYGLV
jgi:hypothetical protein